MLRAKHAAVIPSVHLDACINSSLRQLHLLDFHRRNVIRFVRPDELTAASRVRTCRVITMVGGTRAYLSNRLGQGITGRECLPGDSTV